MPAPLSLMSMWTQPPASCVVSSMWFLLRSLSLKARAELLKIFRTTCDIRAEESGTRALLLSSSFRVARCLRSAITMRDAMRITSQGSLACSCSPRLLMAFRSDTISRT